MHSNKHTGTQQQKRQVSRLRNRLGWLGIWWYGIGIVKGAIIEADIIHADLVANKLCATLAVIYLKISACAGQVPKGNTIKHHILQAEVCVTVVLLISKEENIVQPYATRAYSNPRVGRQHINTVRNSHDEE